MGGVEIGRGDGELINEVVGIDVMLMRNER